MWKILILVSDHSFFYERYIALTLGRTMKKNILVILGHPDTDSFCGALMNAYIAVSYTHLTLPTMQ